MALTLEQENLKNQLIDFVEEWRTNNNITYNTGLIETDLVKFATDLQAEILSKVSFGSLKGGKLVLYSGLDYQEVSNFCQSNLLNRIFITRRRMTLSKTNAQFKRGTVNPLPSYYN